MPQSLNRRHFLSSSLAGASVATLAPAVFAQSPQKTSEADRLVVGVMGLSRGRSLARSFSRRPGVRLKYACDVDDYRADACANEVEKDAGYRPQTISDLIPRLWRIRSRSVAQNAPLPGLSTTTSPCFGYSSGTMSWPFSPRTRMRPMFRPP